MAEYDSLLKEVEECSEEEIQAVRERADAEAERIVVEGRERAEAIRKEYLDIALKSIEMERVQQLFRARAENKSRIMREKYAVFHQAFDQARGRLAGIREDEKYRSVFHAFLEEAVQEMQEKDVVVHIDRRDEALCRECLNALNLEYDIVQNQESMGGMVITTSDGKIVAFNTIEKRLEKAETQLKLDIFSALYGD